MKGPQLILDSIRRISRGMLPYLAFSLMLIPATGWAQIDLYPRAQALGGAYSTLARGYFCVGYNPAGLASPAPYHNYIQLGGLNSYVTNNFFSLATNGKYGGKDITANQAKLQEQLIDDLPASGWRGNFGLISPLPLLNISIGNQAFTSQLKYIGDYYISRAVLDVLYGNMQVGPEYELDLRCDAMMAVEYAYSMAVPYQNVSWGFTLKYIQGIGYYGIDPDYSSGVIGVDTTQFCLSGQGEYHLRNSRKGRGFSADLGVIFREIYGWDIGVSIANIGGIVEWNRSNLTAQLVKSGGLKLMERQFKQWNTDADFDFEDGTYQYTFQIDSLNNLGEPAFFRGDYSFGDFFHDQQKSVPDSAVFKTQVPLILRLGADRYLTDDLQLALEGVAVFQDQFDYRQGWRVSIGIEYSYYQNLPLRLGLAFGGLSRWEVNLGSGLRIGGLHLDWSLGFHQHMWIHKARGINLAVGAYLAQGRHAEQD